MGTWSMRDIQNLEENYSVFELSNGWVRRFKIRYGQEFAGNAGSTDPPIIEPDIQDTLKDL